MKPQAPANHDDRSQNIARNKTRRDAAAHKAENDAQDMVELQVEDLAHGGEGIARLEGRVIFVPGALPGDRIALTPPPVGHKKNFWRSEHFDLLEASPQRIKASCQHRPDCGGCPWHELERDTAGSAKINNVYQSLQRIAHLDLSNSTMLLDRDEAENSAWELWQDPASQLSLARPRKDTGWRLRARFAIKHIAARKEHKQEEKSWAGFYSGASHRIVDIENCVILHPELNRVATKLLALARENAWPSGQVHVSLGFDSDSQNTDTTDGAGPHVAASYVLRPERPKGRGKSANKARVKRLQDSEITSILKEMMQTGLQGAELCTQDAQGQIQQLGQDGDLNLFGLVGNKTDPGLSHDPLSFLQASQAGNAALMASLNKIVTSLELDENPKALELHAGAGNFSFSLAAAGFSVDAVENAPRSAKHLRANIERMQHKDASLQVRIVQADAEDLAALQSQINDDYDLLVLDPPRSGYKPLADLINSNKFNNIIYISCDPASLARDLKALEAQEYQVKAHQIVDMMPGSWQVETVVHLANVGAKNLSPLQ